MQKIDNHIKSQPTETAVPGKITSAPASSLIAGARALPALAGKQELLARLKGVATRIANAVSGKNSAKSDMHEAIAFDVPSERKESASSSPLPSAIPGVDDRVAYLAMVSATPAPTLRSPQLGKQSLVLATASKARVECRRRCRQQGMCRERCALDEETP